MPNQTIVAMFDTAAHASAAVSDLHNAHVPAESISQHAGTSNDPSAAASGATVGQEQSFWGRLFGGEPDHDTAVYDRSIASGATVVTVNSPAEHAVAVSAILEKHNPIDLDERAGQYGASEAIMTRTTAMPAATAPANAAMPAKDGVIQLAEETLKVGKRAVSGGTTRVRSYIVETPVEEQVTLHSEAVTLDRRPVTDGRPVNKADMGRTIEMTGSSEEAVVSKTAHVTEEVSLRREGSDQVQTVKDTVRKDEVEVEQVPAATQTTAQPAPRR